MSENTSAGKTIYKIPKFEYFSLCLKDHFAGFVYKTLLIRKLLPEPYL